MLAATRSAITSSSEFNSSAAVASTTTADTYFGNNNSMTKNLQFSRAEKLTPSIYSAFIPISSSDFGQTQTSDDSRRHTQSCSNNNMIVKQESVVFKTEPTNPIESFIEAESSWPPPLEPAPFLINESPPTSASQKRSTHTSPLDLTCSKHDSHLDTSENNSYEYSRAEVNSFAKSVAEIIATVKATPTTENETKKRKRKRSISNMSDSERPFKNYKINTSSHSLLNCGNYSPVDSTSQFVSNLDKVIDSVLKNSTSKEICWAPSPTIPKSNIPVTNFSVKCEKSNDKNLTTTTLILPPNASANVQAVALNILSSIVANNSVESSSIFPSSSNMTSPEPNIVPSNGLHFPFQSPCVKINEQCNPAVVIVSPVRNPSMHSTNLAKDVFERSGENDESGAESCSSSTNSSGPFLTPLNVKMKRRPDMTPTELKDASYWNLRRKNNEAAKKSRFLRRSKEHSLTEKVKIIEEDNKQLRSEIAKISVEVDTLMNVLKLQLESDIDTKALS